MIQFRVIGEPQPFPKKQINRKTGMVYARDPHGHKYGWMQAVRLTCQTAMKEIDHKIYPEDAPVSLKVTFYRTRPKSCKRMPRPFTKPDVDNLAYAVTNALNGVAYWDDSRVCDLTVSKRWADGCDPGVFVVITVVE